ncbi:ADP-ribosylation factor-like protein 6-interacting protein 1 [Centruroides sculpturatus]|uniref:ADP-ribosylation factor-like protein 6-interacting protein 1 n=1 Tax=Centruroides sculpturatus TaxID=218467 RepID=UPI000C6EDB64|nr:ADP-ribosylation factor-like protein 6-interacting protein 1 [Centruroides sculpturatus]
MAEDGEKPTESGKSVDQDQVKTLKRHLEGWREILLPVNSVLMWEKPFYPAILIGVTSFIFLLVWICEPSVLTTFALLGLLASILDYAVPLISASFFDANKWTGTEEQKFEDICRGLVYTRQCLQDIWDTSAHLKEAKPKVYFVVVLIGLIFVAWIGSLVDNLFLTYLCVIQLVMLPGLKHNGILDKYTSKIVQMIKNFAGPKVKKN